MDRYEPQIRNCPCFYWLVWLLHFFDKYGIKLLTLEFLSTLQTQQDGIYFRMFNQDFSLTWSALKTALGFDHDCSLDLNHATRRFDKVEVLAIHHHLV